MFCRMLESKCIRDRGGVHKRAPGQHYSSLRVICRLTIKASSSKNVKGGMMKMFNMLSIQAFSDVVSLFKDTVHIKVSLLTVEYYSAAV